MNLSVLPIRKTRGGAIEVGRDLPTSLRGQLVDLALDLINNPITNPTRTRDGAEEEMLRKLW